MAFDSSDRMGVEAALSLKCLTTLLCAGRLGCFARVDAWVGWPNLEECTIEDLPQIFRIDAGANRHEQ